MNILKIDMKLLQDAILFYLNNVVIGATLIAFTYMDLIVIEKDCGLTVVAKRPLIFTRL